MKSATRITSTIWGILSTVAGFLFLVFGTVVVNVKDELIQTMMKDDPAMLAADAEKAVTLMGTTFFVLFGLMLIAAIYSFILLILAGRPFNKGLGIALGVIGIVLGSTVPGILFIILYAGKYLVPPEEAPTEA